MASKNTCKYNLYDKFLSNKGISVIYPQNQDEVSSLIEEVKVGKEESMLRDRAINMWVVCTLIELWSGSLPPKLLTVEILHLNKGHAQETNNVNVTVLILFS